MTVDDKLTVNIINADKMTVDKMTIYKMTTEKDQRTGKSND
jgi:hypothetical protein